MSTSTESTKSPTIYDLYNEMEKDYKPDVSQAEAETIRRVLSSLQVHERRRLEKGFNERNFTIGVLNTLLIAYVFGARPEHFWLLFLIEASVLLPLKMWQDYKAKPLCQIFFYMDYCWIMNFLSVGAFLALIFIGDSLDTEARHHLLSATVGICCGPLLCASVFLPFLGTVFHDAHLMTSLFTHIVPPMVLYTFLWHGKEIREAWPDIFQVLSDDIGSDLQFFPQDTGLGGPFFLPWEGIGTISANAAIVYFAWWFFYVQWMFAFGLELTRTKIGVDGQKIRPKYDTVYFTKVRDGYSMQVGGLLGRDKEASKRCMTDGEYFFFDFFLYMTFHALLVFCATNLVAPICLKSKEGHAAFIWLSVVVCVFRGARRYVFWVTSSSSRALQLEYRNLLENSNTKKKL